MVWLGEGELTPFRTGAIVVEVILGFLTFTGSLMAAGKLQEVIPTRPITYRGQNFISLSLLAIAVASSAWLIIRPDAWQLFPVIVLLSSGLLHAWFQRHPTFQIETRGPDLVLSGERPPFVPACIHCTKS